MFDYAHRVLQLSEATSSNLINVARKSLEVPALKEAIEAGALSVSKARKIVPVLTVENQNDWISLATQNTSREIERAVAKENPELAVRETARFVSGNRLELKFGFSEENYEMLKRVCDLESQRTAKVANQELAIFAALEAYLEKYDPIRIAERSLKRGTSGDSQRVTGHTPRPRRPLSAKGTRHPLARAVVHQIYLRDGGQCTHRSSQGIRCQSRRWLDIHHITPLAAGGTDTLANLTTLCSIHHRSIHQTKPPHTKPLESELAQVK